MSQKTMPFSFRSVQLRWRASPFRLPFNDCYKHVSIPFHSVPPLYVALPTAKMFAILLLKCKDEPRVRMLIKCLWQMSKWVTLNRQRTRSLQRFSMLLFDISHSLSKYTDCLRRWSSAGGRYIESNWQKSTWSCENLPLSDNCLKGRYTIGVVITVSL